MEKNGNKDKMVIGLIVGSLYIFFGFVQLFVSLGFHSDLTENLYIPTDIMGSFILILIGIIFIFGVKELRAGKDDGVAYIYMGIFIALIFLVIYLLMMVANAIEYYVIASEDYINWEPLDDLRPGIYLAIIPLIAFILWRAKFSLK